MLRSNRNTTFVQSKKLFGATAVMKCVQWNEPPNYRYAENEILMNSNAACHTNLLQYQKKQEAFNSDTIKFKRRVKFGAFGDGQFLAPRFANTSSDGYIYVSDCQNGKIQVFDLNGVWKETISDNGTLSVGSKARYSYGVAVNSRNDIILCDSHCHQVQFLDRKNMRIKKAVGSFGATLGQFRFPRGLALDSNDNIYVVDHDQHRLQIFSSDGKIQKMIGYGKASSQEGEFKFPWDVAVDKHNGNIYVSDTCNHRIQVFSQDAEQFLFQIGSKGSGKDQLYLPQGIALTNSGQLIVCDPYNHRLQIYDASDGTFLASYTDPGNLDLPCGVATAVDGTNILVVTDIKKHCIHILEMSM